MQTVLDSKSGIRSSESSISSRVKGVSASAPLVPGKHEETTLKTQISAPSYFYSLKENDAPPFKKPDRETKPRLLINTVFTEDDVVEMIAAAESDPEIGFVKFLETIDYAAQREFNAFKLASLLTLYMKTHLYFKWYYWLSPVAVWNYFRELLVRHTIEDSPNGQEVFEPDECYDILTHFHIMYLSNLPLIHILTFGAHRLKYMWPFKPK